MSDLSAQVRKALDAAVAAIEAYGGGYIIYMRDHEGRGIGLTERLKSYTLQDGGLDTADANLALGHVINPRDWSEAIAILKNLKVDSLKLLTNSLEKVAAVTASAITCEQVSLAIASNEYNEKYLSTKRDRLGHRHTQGSK